MRSCNILFLPRIVFYSFCIDDDLHVGYSCLFTENHENGHGLVAGCPSVPISSGFSRFGLGFPDSRLGFVGNRDKPIQAFETNSLADHAVS